MQMHLTKSEIPQSRWDLRDPTRCPDGFCNPLEPGSRRDGRKAAALGMALQSELAWKPPLLAILLSTDECFRDTILDDELSTLSSVVELELGLS